MSAHITTMFVNGVIYNVNLSVDTLAPTMCPCCSGRGYTLTVEGFKDVCFHCEGTGEDPYTDDDS